MATQSSADPAPATTPSKSIITIGTRRSHLARLQTDIVLNTLQSLHPEHTYKVHAMDPLGDLDKSTALYNFKTENAKGLWTSELEALLEQGKLDLIVHSLKDMPTTLPAGLVLGAVMSREDPRDALVLRRNAGGEDGKAEGRSADEILRSLPAGSIIGTSSLRRTAQLKRRYAHLQFRDVRGNVPTRLRKLDHVERPDGFRDTDDERREGEKEEGPSYSALILAAAGLIRLGLGDRISAFLSSGDGGVLHAVGQGALGVEIREGDERIAGLLKGLSDSKTEYACLAERSVMRTLEGGCSVPIGVETEWVGKETLRVRSVVVSLDGSEAVEADERSAVKIGEEADEFGKRVARVLVEKGAGRILDVITASRKGVAEKGDD